MRHGTNKDNRNDRSRMNPSKARKNKKGGIKLAVLHLLQLEPMHGYQIMKELEKKSHGLYTPSAGTIYPALQELLDKNFIDIEQDNEKKVYYINDHGKQFITEFLHGENINFWSEWRKRLRWRQSKGASVLKEELEKWEEELQQAKIQLLNDPQSSSELIAILSDARGQISRWRKEKQEGNNEGEY